MRTVLTKLSMRVQEVGRLISLNWGLIGRRFFDKNYFIRQFLKILFVCFIITNFIYCSSPDSSSSDSSDNSDNSDNSSSLVDAYFGQTYFDNSKFLD